MAATGVIHRRSLVTSALGRFYGIPKIQQPAIERFLPPPVFTPEGRLYPEFLPHILPGIETVFPLGGKSAAELLVFLREHDMLAPSLEVGNLYQSMLIEGEKLGKLASSSRDYRQLSRRQQALQELVQELGLEPVENRKVATKCILDALGFSGVRVYGLHMTKKTWQHLYTEGEEGESRFVKAAVPPEKSEKAFITKLAAGEVEADLTKRARVDGLYYWVEDPHGWNSLHIPDRGQCEFVDTDQLSRDETGDQGQKRKGVGSGQAREIFYLVFNGYSEQYREVYMITNWASNRPLFSNKNQDLALLSTFATSVARAHQQVAAYRREAETSVHDELTKLHNRRYFNSKIETEFLRAQRYKRPFSLIVFDLDHFKMVNDNYGHQAGDFVLQEIAGLFRAEGSLLVRKKIDTICRWGGEEFAIILPETDANNASVAAERIRSAVEKHAFSYGGNILPVTISAGVAMFPSHAKSVADLLHAADMALYSAKEAGRNKVGVAKDSVAA